MFFKKLLAYTFLLVAANQIVRADWTAVPGDPSQYASQYPSCAQAVQRPVNLTTSQAIYYPGLTPINFGNYDQNLYYNFSNNGYTVVAFQTRDLSVRPFINGGDFGSDILFLQQFHFHWGANIYSGSDHLIDGKAYPLEIHLVHQGSSGYIAVVAFLFELSDQDNPNLADLTRIVGVDLGVNGSTVAQTSIGRIIPSLSTLNTNGYYRYLGSLSTPPCNDAILWNIYKNRISISINQLSWFYKNVIKYNTKPASNLGASRPLFVSVPK